MFVTLRCAECDNVDCDIARRYVPDGSLEGCTRGLDDAQAQALYHCVSEVLPFLHLRGRSATTDAQFQEIDGCLGKAYAAPLGRRIAADGKVAE